MELTVQAGHPAPKFEAIAGSVVVRFRPKTGTINPKITEQVARQVTPEVTPEVRGMLSILEGEMNRSEIMAALGLRDEKHFRQHYQQTAVAAGLIEMTIPDKPQSRLQKYRLTDNGRAVLERLKA